MARTFHGLDWRRGRWEERRFAPTIAKHLEAEFRDNGKDTFARVDGDLWRKGKIVGVVELKRHYRQFGSLPEVMFEEAKLRAVLRRAAQHAVPGYVAVRFDNADVIAELDLKLDYRQAEGGRFDRGDPQDRQPMMFVPVDQFTKMKTVPYQRTPEALEDAAAEALGMIRRKRTVRGVNDAAIALETLVWELEECPEGLVRARAHHIRNLCAVQRQLVAVA